jgi:hypothetical protein
MKIMVVLAAVLLLLRETDGTASWPPCADPTADPGDAAANITDVHLVMMNHLDVGFGEQNGSQTGYINNVLNEYFEVYFPRAVQVAGELRARGGPERMVYTTHGWLVHLYVHCPTDFVLSGIVLKCPSAADVASFKTAARQGDIVWQAGAFNSQYELAFNADMVDEQFRLSASLADELGVPRSRVLSLRDVPGTTRSLIPLLVRNNITALTVGVNNGAPNPDMPSPGLWADPGSNTSVLFMQTGPGVGYPAREANHGGLCRRVCVTAPKLKHAMCWAFRPDNSGPPESTEEVVSYFTAARTAFPGATVHASTHDRFVQQLATVQADLPVATGEVGDTWVTSQTADPWKWIFYREAARAYTQCKAAGRCDPVHDRRVSEFLRLLVKLPEHTGGPDSFQGGGNWTNVAFHAAIAAKSQGVVVAERAYREQREIASVIGLKCLGDHPLSHNITQRIVALRPGVPNTALLVEVPPAEWATPITAQTSVGPVSLGVDLSTGGLSTVMMAGFNWAGKHNQIAQYVYKTFNDTDYSLQRGFCCYGPLPDRQRIANPNRTTTSPRVTGVWHETAVAPRSLTARLKMPDLQHEQYGAPHELWLAATVEKDGSVSIDLQAFNKTTTRLGEASFARFRPKQRDGFRWLMDKLGSWVDPLDTVTNGSLHSHGIRDGVAYVKSGSRHPTSPQNDAFFAVDSLDAFVADPATTAEPATNFLSPLAPLTGPVVGFDMQLHQNAFATNMPLFSLDSEFRWRFRLRAAVGPDPPDTPSASGIERTPTANNNSLHTQQGR